MPKKLERKLRATAARRGYSRARSNAYVYGSLRRSGWKPKQRRKKLPNWWGSTLIECCLIVSGTIAEAPLLAS